MKKFVGTIEVAHTGKESLIYDLAKILGCDDTEEQVVDAVKRLKAESVLQDFANSVYDPEFGDKRFCTCGHNYYRHFDSHEDMAPVGCKYCDCRLFNEQI